MKKTIVAALTVATVAGSLVTARQLQGKELSYNTASAPASQPD